jgi:hypothetical protein
MEEDKYVSPIKNNEIIHIPVTRFNLEPLIIKKLFYIDVFKGHNIEEILLLDNIFYKKDQQYKNGYNKISYTKRRLQL